MAAATWPSRETIERIAAEEGARFGLPVAAVIGANITHVAIEARRAWVRRVLRETGCSKAGLAEVSGIDRKAVQRFAKEFA